MRAFRPVEFTDRDTILAYQNVFLGTDSGRLVLFDMLQELGLLHHTDGSPEEMALKNYANRLVHLCGGMNDDKTRAEAVRGMIGRLRAVPVNPDAGIAMKKENEE